jgi:hypothetical protein
MHSMYSGADKVGQNLSAWDVSKVISRSYFDSNSEITDPPNWKK